MRTDYFFMTEALNEADKALAKNEVPIGAVVVKDGIIIGRGHNRRETLNDPTEHAELSAIKMAAKTLGSWRLTNCALYVTLEPCPMCAGAIVNSRLSKLVFGAYDPKAGAVSSLMNLVQDSRLNHQVEVLDGIAQDECSKILKDFFVKLRQRSNSK